MSITAENCDDDLIVRLRQGDEQAFLALFRGHQGAVYRFALQMCGSSSVAEDVTQEVFLSLIRSNFGYDAAKGALSAYLYGIARKQVLRHLYRGRGHVSLDANEMSGNFPSGQLDVIEDLTRREGLEALRKALLALPPKYREVVVLCDLEELDYAAAAAALGCAVGTIRSRLHRARGLLGEKLNRLSAPGAARDGLDPARCLT